MKWLARLFVRKPKLAGLKPGQAGEKWVEYLYRREGFEILARNYEVFGKKKFGEIDIVCQRQKILRIVEVKTRSNESFMNIEDTIDWRKQHFLRRMTKLFLQANPIYDDWGLQIDVALVLLNPVDNSVQSVKLIENAIEDS